MFAKLTEDGLQGGFDEIAPGVFAEVVSTRAPLFQIDLAGSSRVSQRLTLFDGKILGEECPSRWDTKGTGTATFENNTISMSVTEGEYLVRQGKLFCPYFSGKPQFIEATAIGFHNQAGITKRIGYFSSNAVAPYDSDKDGLWLEADGTTHRLVCSRKGVITHNIPLADWDNAADFADYDWSKFTVIGFDFLWLGGAGLRLFVVKDGQFTLAHTITDHAGYQDGLIFLSPNQPIRYEIRSATGLGEMNSVCSQVATEGASESEQGKSVAFASAVLPANVVGTVYAVCGIRKQESFRDVFSYLKSFDGLISSNQTETGLLYLLSNPTLSAPLNYSNVSRIQFGTPTSGTTVTSLGRVLKVVPLRDDFSGTSDAASFMRNLLVGIDNSMDELVLAYSPLSSTQNIVGAIEVVEY